MKSKFNKFVENGNVKIGYDELNVCREVQRMTIHQWEVRTKQAAFGEF